MKKFLRIDSSYPIDKILPFCEHSINDPRPGASNMSPVNWENNNASFLYLLYHEKRYDGAGNGYIIYTEDDHILCGAGFSVSDIDPYMTHLSSRTYTIPGIVLHKAHGDIHTMSIDISEEEGRYGAFSSVNEYNKKLFYGYARLNDPKNYPKYFMKDGKHYGKPNIRIHPMEPFGPVMLKGTKQWMQYILWNEAHRASFVSVLESIKLQG
jgi:hypothetical protein